MASSTDLFDLKGRRALITGASRGIGLAIAEGLGTRGASVIITGRKADTLAPVADRLRAGGVDAQPMVCHQGDPAAIANLFQELDRQDKAVDIAIINAATNPVMGSLLEVDLGAWQKIMEVNLTGALLTTQQAARRMVARKGGSVVIISSIAGIDPMPAIAAYSVSKAGPLGMMRTFAKELGPLGVRVNAIAPGLIETKFSAALFQDKHAYQQVVGHVPMRRHGQPED